MIINTSMHNYQWYWKKNFFLTIITNNKPTPTLT